jgi:LysM repeat protein
MTEDQSTTEQTGRTRAARSYGWGPVTAAGGIVVGLAALLVVGSWSVAGAMTSPVAVSSSQAPSTPEPGVETPGAEDPSTPPDRGSDPTPTPAQPDTIYLIQNGDTLTSISAKLGVSIDAIAAYNAVRDVNVISAGAALRVPFIYVPPSAGQ